MEEEQKLPPVPLVAMNSSSRGGMSSVNKASSSNFHSARSDQMVSAHGSMHSDGSQTLRNPYVAPNINQHGSADTVLNQSSVSSSGKRTMED
jgi:hypothetical protein